MNLLRAVRCLGWDGNPLRRRADRVEAWLTVVLAATFLLVGPVAAWRAGHAVYREELAAARVADDGHVRISAILEQDAALTYSGSEGSPPVQNPVWASWRRPDGIRQRGRIVPDAPAPAGTAVPVWTDASGNLIAAPRTESDIRQTGVSVAFVVLLGVLAVCGGACWLLRRLADHRRMASWQREWTRVEPRWTGRR
jgi:hypothetical protein